MIAALIAAAAAAAPLPQTGTCTLLVGDEDVGCRRVAISPPGGGGPTQVVVVDGGAPLGFSGRYSAHAALGRGTVRVDTMLSGASTATAEGSCYLEFARPDVLSRAECEAFSAYGQVRLTFIGAAR